MLDTWHNWTCSPVQVGPTTHEAEWFVYRHHGIFRASWRGLEASRQIADSSGLLRRRQQLGRGAHINGTTLTPCRPVLRVRCSHVLSTRCCSIFILAPFFLSLSLSPAVSFETRLKTEIEISLSRTSKIKFRKDEHQYPRQDLRAEVLARHNDRAKIMDHRQQVS